MVEKKASAIVILGASGDLARRKLIPALARLHGKGEIADGSIVVGSGRTDYSDIAFRDKFMLDPDFSKRVYYHKGIAGLKAFIAEKGSFQRIIIFMALPPSVYSSTASELVGEGFGNEVTLIIEKPFGYDYISAKKLNGELTARFNESQIFRIDHYLAKEAVQNILVFRFANTIFHPVWNSRFIDSIQINAFEQEGVGNRGSYFDKAGIIRDMIQNHLVQLICLLTMEAPVSLDAEEIRAQKINILKAVKIDKCCRSQYRGYRDEGGIVEGSKTETYAEIRLYINTFRWTGMPVYIRAGKALNRKGTEIGVKFKTPPPLLFNERGNVSPNKIIFKIQPSEGIVLDLSSKTPGSDIRITDTKMRFCYRDSFDDETPEAYQKLLLDALRGDRTLFVGAEETELSWKKIEPFLDRGNLGLYNRGEVPPPCLLDEWIDFEKYGAVCD